MLAYAYHRVRSYRYRERLLRFKIPARVYFIGQNALDICVQLDHIDLHKTVAFGTDKVAVAEKPVIDR